MPVFVILLFEQLIVIFVFTRTALSITNPLDHHTLFNTEEIKQFQLYRLSLRASMPLMYTDISTAFRGMKDCFVDKFDTRLTLAYANIIR